MLPGCCLCSPVCYILPPQDGKPFWGGKAGNTGTGKWEFISAEGWLHVYLGHQGDEGGGRLLKQLCEICSLFSLMSSSETLNREWNMAQNLAGNAFSSLKKLVRKKLLPVPAFAVLAVPQGGGRSSAASCRGPHGAPGAPWLPQETRQLWLLLITLSSNNSSGLSGFLSEVPTKLYSLLQF